MHGLYKCVLTFCAVFVGLILAVMGLCAGMVLADVPERIGGGLAMSSDMGYRFQSATTANGCLMVCITPHTRRRDFRSKVYVFTPEEVRGLIGCLAVLPDGPE